MTDQEDRFTPHSTKQDDLIFSDEDLTIGATGTQWGKSMSAALWMKRQIHSFTSVQDNFLLMAPTYKIMNQSMLPYFLHVMAGYGEHHKADAEFRIHDGGMVYFRTGKDPDSIVGIPRVRAYWLDEAGKATLYFWENIQARAASVGARGLLTTSPYSRNWLYKDFVRPIEKNKPPPNLKFIKAASWENPYHTLHDPAKRSTMRQTMDPRRFDMVFGGEWGQMIGLVYDCWDDDLNICKPFDLPTGTRFVAGVDWGYTDPFVMSIRGITPSGYHYKVSEFYKTQMTIKDIIEVAKQKQSVWNIECFYCGPDQPGYIEEFNRNKLTAVGAVNDIRLGIDAHYELIKSRKFQVFEGACPHTIDEIESYHYPEPDDLGPDDDSKDELPVGQNDHALDSDRYCTIMTVRSSVKKAPKTPGEVVSLGQETFEQRMSRLKRKPKVMGE